MYITVSCHSLRLCLPLPRKEAAIVSLSKRNGIYETLLLHTLHLRLSVSACPREGETPALESGADRRSQQLQRLGGGAFGCLPAIGLCGHQPRSAVHPALSRQSPHRAVAGQAIPVGLYRQVCTQLPAGLTSGPATEHAEVVGGTRQGVCPLSLPLARPYPAPACQP